MGIFPFPHPKVIHQVFRHLCAVILLAIILWACSTAPSIAPSRASEALPASPTMPNSEATSTPSKTPPDSALDVIPTVCALDPVIVPILPSEIPGYTQLDPTTNLHVTGRSFEVIDVDSYQLEVTGRVDHPLRLSYDDLRCMPRIEARARLVCLGFFEDEATWAGASLIHILDLAGVQAEASRIEMIGADGYTNTLSLPQALKESNFLAYEWEGEPLPILHGFPLRAVFPGEYGARWVKWLVKIEIK